MTNSWKNPDVSAVSIDWDDLEQADDSGTYCAVEFPETGDVLVVQGHVWLNGDPVPIDVAAGYLAQGYILDPYEYGATTQ